MEQNNKYSVINIRRYLESDNPMLGEDVLIQILSEFSCKKNLDVERFLKSSAIEFAKKNQSVTYLVFSAEDGELLGYFTIALKPLTVKVDTVSNTMKKKMLRISELDEQSESFTMSAYLIAQLGKNYANGANTRISGTDLLDAAWNVVKEIQYRGGGLVAFLEANNEDKLLAFYNENRFQQFDIRQTNNKDDELHELVQLLKLVQ